MRAYYDYTYYRPRHKRYSYMTGNDVEYTYGTSGNETGRFLFWTEDCYGCEHLLCQSNEVSNRMHAAVDEKYSSYYVYDHSGERRVKLTGTNDLLDVNADYMYTASVLREPTIYPSAYMTQTLRKSRAEQARLFCRDAATSRNVNTIMPGRSAWQPASEAVD